MIAARLKGRRIGRGATEPAIEATLHKRLDGSHWQAFILGAKKVQVGDTLRFGAEGKVCFLGQLDAQVSQKDEGGRGNPFIFLPWSGAGPGHRRARRRCRCRPISPRAARRTSRTAPTTRRCLPHDEGSVAAPTAGLHFTDDLLARLTAARRRPAQGDAACRRRHLPAGEGGRHRRPHDACRIRRGVGARWPRRSMPCAPKAGASSRSARPRCGCWKARPARTANCSAFAGETAIFITPGYRFRAVDLMLTNFHLPRSTLFMLVAAFSGLDDDETRLCACDCGRLSLLFLWRACLLYPQPNRRHARPWPGIQLRSGAPKAWIAVTSPAMTKTNVRTFFLHHLQNRRRRAPRRIVTPHGRCRRRPSCRWARRHGEGADAARRCAQPAPKSCSATPII